VLRRNLGALVIWRMQTYRETRKEKISDVSIHGESQRSFLTRGANISERGERRAEVSDVVEAENMRLGENEETKSSPMSSVAYKKKV